MNARQALIEGHLNRVNVAAKAYIDALEAQKRCDDEYPAGGIGRSAPDATQAEIDAWSVRMRQADQQVRDTLAALCQAVADGR